MIVEHFLFPEYYVAKEPKCDDCKVTLRDTQRALAVNPPVYIFACPKCGKEYNYTEKDLKGEWKFRII